MEQNSRSKFRPWPEFEPRTSYLAVQHATARVAIPLLDKILLCLAQVAMFSNLCTHFNDIKANGTYRECPNSITTRKRLSHFNALTKMTLLSEQTIQQG